MKLKRILLTLFLGIGLIGVSIAGAYDDWTDDVVCMWLDIRPTNAGYKAEVQKRGIGCEGGKVVAGSAKTKATTKSTSTTKKTSTTKSKASTANSDITIYEVVFPATVLKKLLDRVISKLDYDFSKHKLANNAHDFSCSFRIQKVVYEKSELGELEHWNVAQGTINIQDSNVEFVNSRWQMGGLSTDPSYFRDEVNIKLTEDGHLVGKMAYFPIGVKQGEVPVNPDYVTLTKHKRSTPIFSKQGFISFISGDEDAIFDVALESGADDIVLNDDGSIYVVTSPEYFIPVRDALITNNLTPDNSQIDLKGIGGKSAELWIDVRDWAGGVMFVRCNYK
jgi:hypothetical protein